jgi:hypothetical protein
MPIRVPKAVAAEDVGFVFPIGLVMVFGGDAPQFVDRAGHRHR